MHQHHTSVYSSECVCKEKSAQSPSRVDLVLAWHPQAWLHRDVLHALEQEDGFAVLPSLQSRRIIESRNGLGGKGPLKAIQSKPYHGQGHLPLDQVAQSPVQPDPECFQGVSDDGPQSIIQIHSLGWPSSRRRRRQGHA